MARIRSCHPRALPMCPELLSQAAVTPVVLQTETCGRGLTPFSCGSEVLLSIRTVKKAWGNVSGWASLGLLACKGEGKPGDPGVGKARCWEWWALSESEEAEWRGVVHPLLRTCSVPARNSPQWAAGIAISALWMRTWRCREVGCPSVHR